MKNKHTDNKRKEDIESGTLNQQDTAREAPILPPDAADESEAIEPTGQDLNYNEEAGSFEFDPELGEGEYKHPDPYNTAVPRAQDHMSTYDEANPYEPDEYRDKRDGLEEDSGSSSNPAVDPLE
ncbi:MAG TPA: hypothetical protein VFD72_00480 [Sphingobacteriaceae bacterium]|nr:hypothetical protein [Sphingobacteriaceae bacterium]